MSDTSFDTKRLYIRNNSKFHKWLRDNNLIDNVDANANFLYLGQIFDSPLKDNENITNATDKETFYFDHYALKNYCEAAIPSVNRKDQFIQFIRLYFDEVYQHIYNKQKSMLDIINPLITYDAFLELISYSYGFEYDNLDIFSEHCIRYFLAALPYLIKMKGTFAAFYLIFKLLFDSTTNRLNIYRLWMNGTQTTDWRTWTNEIINPLTFETQEVLYYIKDALSAFIKVPENGELYDLVLNSEESNFDYGAGFGYYNDIKNSYTYDPTKILTTHYILEFDVTEEPMFSYQIWGTDFVNLINMMKKFRPACRVQHTGFVIGPITDWSGNWYEIYDTGGVSYKTRYNAAFSRDVDSFIYLQNIAKTVWTFKHPLNTLRIMVQCYNTKNEQIHPYSIEYVSMEEVKVTFKKGVAGYVIVKCTTSEKFFLSTNNTVFDYGYADYPIIAERSIYNYIIPNSQHISDDKNSLTSGFLDNYLMHTDMLVRADVVFEQTTPGTIWTFAHNSGYSANLIMVYDINNNVIYPKTIKNTDENTITVTFNSPTAGKIAVNHIGNPISPATEIPLLRNGGYFEFGIGTWTDAEVFTKLKATVITTSITKAWEDEEYLYLQTLIPEGPEVDIKEVGIFDSLHRLIFYSKISGLLKTSESYGKFHYRIKK